MTIDLREMGKVKEVDKTSRAALIEGGTYGPSLEAQLRPHGLTLRHFPQSFEYSTLGGWIATRGGGHFATLYTHIDDFVESLRTVTPQGVMESRRLPGSGAGPSPDRMMIGSEGILGIITQAWMRLQDRPTFRAGGAVRFKDFFTAARAVRAMSQAGSIRRTAASSIRRRPTTPAPPTARSPSWCWRSNSADHDVDPWMKRARECCADHGGTPEASGADAHLAGAAGVWRNAFIRMPYAMERLILRGVINDTFETAITWDRFETFHDAIKGATENAISEATGRKGQVTCRFTHVYPDGPAPYFTFHALGEPGKLGAQWRAIKGAALDAVIANGGTVTHHHAVGRDHRPVVRPAAPAAVRRCAARREEGARPARPAQSRRADRSMSFAADFKPARRPSPRRTTTRAGARSTCSCCTTPACRSGEEALARLTDPSAKVSSHYFVDEDGRIDQLVPEARRAWHAGLSSWKGVTDINSRSIGIEIVNPGHEYGYRDFPDAQIDAVIALCRDIIARRNIPRARACSRIPTSRRRARRIPARNFPGRGLPPPASGCGSSRRRSGRPRRSRPNDRGPQVANCSARLPVSATARGHAPLRRRRREVVTAFQRHFRPARVDGLADPIDGRRRCGDC